LIDAVVCFHGPLPEAGKTIRYDIRIDRFERQGDSHLFFFRFDGSVDGKPLLTMRDGCAGFFDDEALRQGKGIVLADLERKPRPGKHPEGWKPWVAVKRGACDAAQVRALRSGDLAGAFGSDFEGLDILKAFGLPGGKMSLIDRIPELDPQGGKYGLGFARAEADILPDDWFLTCHFSDDPVMPGTLMYECCLHTLRALLMRLGFVGEDSLRWEPVPGIKSRLKCRGQVLPTTRKAAYEISIKEIGYGPEPYAIADALMFADGKPIVHITDMSLRLVGIDHARLERLWSSRRQPPSKAPLRAAGDRPGRPPIFDRDRILAFAVGKPSDAFGDRYRVFDRERVIARLPGPPYQFLDRIVRIDAKPWTLEAGGSIDAEYDVPDDAWYFAANRQPTMPFSVLLEVALQPCGWLAAYLGSALHSDTDLSFRNLGGKAVVHREVLPEDGTLTTAVKITKVSLSGGMIIQNFGMSIRRAKDGALVYGGDTHFGFFSKQALADQRGVLGQTPYVPAVREAARGERIAFPEFHPRDPEDPRSDAGEGPALPAKALSMLDSAPLFVPDGGPNGLGFLRGIKRVDPKEWFFTAHFHQDPVCPGSLGLESFLQLLKVAALERWGESRRGRFTPIGIGQPHEWVYRGQITPKNALVTVEAVVTRIDDARKRLTADGFLSVDGLLIYHMKNFSIERTDS